MRVQAPLRNSCYLVSGMVLLSFSFRTPITSLSPVLEVIQQDLGLSYTVTSLLTMLPTACFGAFAFAAAPISRRMGRERGIFWATVLVGLGTILRVWGANPLILYGTTLVVGAGIAISQTLLPSLISEYFAERTALVTGLYTASLTIGAGVAAGSTAFIHQQLGSWTASLAIWGVPALLAAGFWAPLSFDNRRVSGTGAWGAGLPWQNRWTWALTLFYGGQSLLFYTTITWLAPRYIALGWTPEESSFLLMLFFTGQLAGTLGLAPLSDYWRDRRPWIALVLLITCIGFLGVIVRPLTVPTVWTVLLGMGLGGVFALNMALPVDFTSNSEATSRLTAVMVGVGYLFAALGPLIAGIIRDVTGGFRLSFVALLLISIALLASSVFFHPDRTVD